MVGMIFEDLRRLLLSLLFVIAFGWMAAQIMPGAAEGGDTGAQVAFTGDVVPPHP